MKYVLITPARNEGPFIKKTLDSMLVQTVRPERWVIVDDGSTDNTAEIVVPFAEQVSWIELLRRARGYRLVRRYAGLHEWNGRESPSGVVRPFGP